MEPPKVRFVRCPKCYQLLVEYPSIPVYKCGGCNTVLRAKNRAVPAVQTNSEYDEQNKFPSSLKSTPRDNKSICSDEQKIASSVDQPREAAANAIICSPVNYTNSCEDTIEERAVSAVDHQKEETCSSIDNTPNPGVTVKEMHEKGLGADFGSNSIEELENLDTSQTASRGKVEIVQMTETSTMCEKTEVARREERLHANNDMHVESHEALIEELERSLSLSSDDEYFSDEAETSGLSDALRHQMGSRRFMLGGRTDSASRSDPHGRLIEELEMSFSDAEEPMEQHPAVIDRIHEIKHDKHPQTLDAEIANPCEESISSLDSGHFELEQTLHPVNRPVENGNQGKENIEDDNKAANDVHGNEHDMRPQTLGAPESAHPCEESIPSLDNGYLESEQSFHEENRLTDNGNEGKEDIEDDNDIANDVHGNEHIVDPNEVGEERFHEKEHDKDWHPADSEITHSCEDIEDDNDIANGVRGNEHIVAPNEVGEERFHEKEHNKDWQPGDSEITHPCDVSSIDDSDIKSIPSLDNGYLESEQTFHEENRLIDDGNEGKEDIDDVHGNEHIVTPNEVGEERFHEKEHDNDWQPADSEIRHPCDVSSIDDSDIKLKQTIQPNGLIADATQEKEEDCIEDAKMTNYIDGNENPVFTDEDIAVKVHSNEVVRYERLKKMDELRDQLTRLSSQKGMEKKYQKRGLEYLQQSNSYDVEQHLQSVDVDSYALESYYGHERKPRYQAPNPLSPTQTYPHCHFGHAQKSIPYNYDMWEFNSYYQSSSYAESTVLDQDFLIASYKEPKRMVRKHILRPLSGASPFSICSSCFNLVQMPSDMYISKAKIGKMQCGKCSKVLVLSFPVSCHGEGKISGDDTQQTNQPAGGMVAKNKDATSHSAECLGGSVSLNKECGASFTRSFSTQARTSLAATQSSTKISDSALHRLMGYDSASQLLRHSRALEDGYDSFESMVPVSTRISRRKNM